MYIATSSHLGLLVSKDMPIMNYFSPASIYIRDVNLLVAEMAAVAKFIRVTVDIVPVVFNLDRRLKEGNIKGK